MRGRTFKTTQYVANYDFPWNPVVLIQRTGRIDRIGSKYGSVYVLNVLPVNGNIDDPHTIEHFIKLMKKLYQKLEGIKSALGVDSPVLGEDADPRDFGDAQLLISKNDNTLLERLTREAEQFSDDPKDRLSEIMEEMVIDKLKSIPYGIGAHKFLDRDGIFALFTDGTGFHWRLRWLDGKRETVKAVK
ncbi:helicase domain-containing protein [mine drainage metagenome]|uniref:Helicase domain-containing protein n=1 Tax=mine drainage metagenome TaxID=410659 RepID=T0Y8A3_9ZZZZ